ncbi:MAG: HAMP domain-containing sensor histidine kinase [Planctomycetota bacterium]
MNQTSASRPDPDEPGTPRLPVLGSRFGRRLLALFVGCALVPILALAIVSRESVSTRLREDADESLHAQTKSVGTALAERLLRIERDLEIVGMSPTAQGPGVLPSRVATRLDETFLWLTINELEDDGSEELRATLVGTATKLPPLDADERAHLNEGRSLVRTFDRHIELSLLVESAGAPRLVRGMLNHDALFGAFGVRPPVGVVHVLDRNGRSLHDSHTRLGEDELRQIRRAEGSIEWSDPNGEVFIGRAWRLFLEPRHRINWLIVHGRPKAEVLTAIRGIESMLIGVALLTTLIVVALSLVQIRRILDPIRKLILGTRAIKAGRLEAKVGLNREDEFGDLGESFDEMVSALRIAIDRREKTEGELRHARDDALRAARAQASFVTNVSHEFRTPVACVLASAEILRDFSEGDPEACREFSDAILQDARHLTRLIEDTLALSGGDEVSSALPTEHVPVDALFGEVVMQRSDADRSRIHVECEDQLPTFEGEPRQILRMIDRLLDNALKFSGESSQVNLRAFVTSGENGEQLLIEVQDFGEGIAESDLHRIFDRFVQVGRNERTEKAEGTGIGLALARRIARSHGTTITVESAPGEGSTFRVAFRLEAQGVTSERGEQEDDHLPIGG